MAPGPSILRPGIAALIAALMLATAPRVRGDAAPGDSGIHRLLHLFDFEEADEQNFEDMPRHWFVIGRGDQTSEPNFIRQPLHQALLKREGFPRFALVRFDIPQVQKGNHTLAMSLNGGSAGAFLELGTLAAVPGSDYIITTRVRTSALKHARARLAAYFVDGQGKRIDASIVASDYLNTAGQWETASVKLSGDFPSAAWIGIQLELLQPQHQMPLMQDAAVGMGRFAVQYQEVDGHAWFDDLAIWQSPQIVVRTQSPENLIAAPHRPQLTMDVRDLTGRKMTAHVEVFDARGRKVAAMRRTIGGGEPTVWHWAPTLPALGWYLADLTLKEQIDPGAAADEKPTVVARTLRAFLWSPAASKEVTSEQRRFSLALHDAPLKEVAVLPEVFAVTGLRSAMISGWSRDVTTANLDDRLNALDQLLQPIMRHGGQVIMNLSPTPAEMNERLEAAVDNPLSMFAAPTAHWSPYLEPMVLRHGQYARQWQFGVAGAVDLRRSDTLKLAVAAVEAMRHMTPQPLVLLPWDLQHPRPAGDVAPEIEFILEVPPSVQPHHIPDHLAEWRKPPAVAYSLRLDVPPATELTQARRISDLSIRMLHAWSAEPRGLSLRRPWVYSHNRFHTLQPDPLLGVFATVSQSLRGRQFVGPMVLGDQVEALLFNGQRGGLLAAWRPADGDDHPAEVALYLGESPRAHDVWGNPVELPMAGGKHLLQLTDTPLLIEGVDAELLQFRTSFTLDAKLVESTQGNHEHKIVLTNPWKQPVQGELSIVSPGRTWRFEPRRMAVTIDPGAKIELPVSIAFPVNEVAGRKALEARFDFATGNRPPLELTTQFEVGLPDIRLETGLILDANPQTGKTDAVANAFITNTGQTTRNLYAFAIMAGHPRQERIVTLKPGQSIIRRFTFPAAAEQLDTVPLRVGLRDAFGPALMSHLLSRQDAGKTE